MKKLIRKFVKRNIAYILSKFHTMIDELEAVSVEADAKADALLTQIDKLNDEKNAHIDESERARRAAAKIKAVFAS